MKSTEQITNSQDIIDSRDVIARIEALREERDSITETEDQSKIDEWNEGEEKEELDALEALQEEAEGYCADWQHGGALIRDSHFRSYAEELAEDVGAINRDGSWPNNCIDWERAAQELQQDYTAVEFAGMTYWTR